MKKILTSSIITTALLVGLSHAAVTFTVNNYTGSTFGPNGLPIVNAAGVPAPLNTVYAAIGYMTNPSADWSTMTSTTILSSFVSVDAVGVSNASYAGLFNGQDYSSSTNVYPAGFVGKQGFLVVGDSANIQNSSKIAVFTLGTFFPAAAADNTASYTIQLSSDTSSMKFGQVVGVTQQPRVDTNDSNNYINGVQLVSAMVPETSTALLGALGALGLLRRRR